MTTGGSHFPWIVMVKPFWPVWVKNILISTTLGTFAAPGNLPPSTFRVLWGVGWVIQALRYVNKGQIQRPERNNVQQEESSCRSLPLLVPPSPRGEICGTPLPPSSRSSKGGTCGVKRSRSRRVWVSSQQQLSPAWARL